MALSMTELLAALPVGADEERPPEETLRQWMTELSTKPVPVGALQRLWAATTLQAKIALAYVAHWVRSGFADADENARRLNETHLAAAIKLLHGMGYLRGTIMKAGQMLANYPSIAPAHFADILAKLHFEAPPMHFSLLRETVRNELGAEPEELFDDFETRAFAAASLGQVHRARLKSGPRVAVKIQYPSIARTIRDDFRAFTALFAAMRLCRDWDNVKQQWDLMHRTIEAETDYEREAEWLRKARSAFGEDDDDVVVPRVYPEFSTRRVLTMDYLDGKHIRAFMASDPPQDVRDRHGAQVFQSSMRLWYRARMIYADPHPGNFLFMPDGRLGLIDFGCCHGFTDEEWDFVYRTEADGKLDARSERMRYWYARGVDLEDERQVGEDRMRLLQDYTGWLWEPFRTREAFDFSDEDYLHRGVTLVGELFRRGYIRSKPVNVWLTRSFWGVRAMAHRLRARIPVRAILDSETTVRPGGDEK